MRWIAILLVFTSGCAVTGSVSYVHKDVTVQVQFGDK